MIQSNINHLFGHSLNCIATSAQLILSHHLLVSLRYNWAGYLFATKPI